MDDLEQWNHYDLWARENLPLLLWNSLDMNRDFYTCLCKLHVFEKISGNLYCFIQNKVLPSSSYCLVEYYGSWCKSSLFD
ncbi:Os02g0222500 [Oryza sativa Japonica Group]|uniref:Os02g0222500 protein n=1 Tax=Oryza sativa subsp. japonica TaxID=39947 RepID=Q0E2P7_ORYSJ|nr:Os02g0222500 [Oryza sativa Japonica Group]|eukprot:NP_001046327.1 Os02g0222500 [Oryza sativa Japonica Group]